MSAINKKGFTRHFFDEHHEVDDRTKETDIYAHLWVDHDRSNNPMIPRFGEQLPVLVRGYPIQLTYNDRIPQDGVQTATPGATTRFKPRNDVHFVYQYDLHFTISGRPTAATNGGADIHWAKYAMAMAVEYVEVIFGNEDRIIRWYPETLIMESECKYKEGEREELELQNTFLHFDEDFSANAGGTYDVIIPLRFFGFHHPHKALHTDFVNNVYFDVKWRAGGDFPHPMVASTIALADGTNGFTAATWAITNIYLREHAYDGPLTDQKMASQLYERAIVAGIQQYLLKEWIKMTPITIAAGATSQTWKPRDHLRLSPQAVMWNLSRKIDHENIQTVAVGGKHYGFIHPGTDEAKIISTTQGTANTDGDYTFEWYDGSTQYLNPITPREIYELYGKHVILGSNNPGASYTGLWNLSQFTANRSSNTYSVQSQDEPVFRWNWATPLTQDMVLTIWVLEHNFYYFEPYFRKAGDATSGLLYAIWRRKLRTDND